MNSLKMLFSVVVFVVCFFLFAAESENFFVKISSESGKVEVDSDGSFRIQPDDAATQDDILVEVVPQQDWQLITPASGKLIVSPAKSAHFKVRSVLGEDDFGGDIHVCYFPSVITENHSSSPKIKVEGRLVGSPYVYAKPDLNKNVAFNGEAIETSVGSHEVVLNYLPCIYCGKNRSPSVERTFIETHFDSFEWEVSFNGTTTNFTSESFTMPSTKLPKGTYPIKATCTAKASDCSHCRDVETATTNALVSELTVVCDAWIGLDRTNEATIKEKTATSKLDPEQTGLVCEWKWDNSIPVCNLSPSADSFSCTITPKDKDTASRTYLAEKLTATVADAQVSTNLTVVKVDVTIEGCSEVKEETEGAFVACTNDVKDVTIPVNFTCEPANLPSNEVVKIDFKSDICELLEEENPGSFVPLKASYRASALASKNFKLRGIKPSNGLRDTTITIKHEKSGAIDKIMATACGIDYEVVKIAPNNSNPRRKKIGVGEEIKLTARPSSLLRSLSCTYGSMVGNIQTTTVSSTIYTGPGLPCYDTIRASFECGVSAMVNVNVVAPSGCLAQNTTSLTVGLNLAGVAMLNELFLLPLDVNFYKIETREVPMAAINVHGYFANPLIYPNGFPAHDASVGAGRWIVVKDSFNANGHDEASTGYLNQPWSDGDVVWPIPVEWRMKNRNEGFGNHQFGRTDQFMRILSNGTASVSKYGITITRTTNDVVNAIRNR